MAAGTAGLRLWNLETGANEPLDRTPCGLMDVSADGRRIVAGCKSEGSGGGVGVQAGRAQYEPPFDLLVIEASTGKRRTNRDPRPGHRVARGQPVRGAAGDRRLERDGPRRAPRRQRAAPARRRGRGRDLGRLLARRPVDRLDRGQRRPPLADAGPVEAAAPHAAARGADGEAGRASRTCASSGTRTRRPARSWTSARSPAGRTCRNGDATPRDFGPCGPEGSSGGKHDPPDEPASPPRVGDPAVAGLLSPAPSASRAS